MDEFDQAGQRDVAIAFVATQCCREKKKNGTKPFAPAEEEMLPNG